MSCIGVWAPICVGSMVIWGLGAIVASVGVACSIRRLKKL